MTITCIDLIHVIDFAGRGEFIRKSDESRRRHGLGRRHAAVACGTLSSRQASRGRYPLVGRRQGDRPGHLHPGGWTGPESPGAAMPSGIAGSGDPIIAAGQVERRLRSDRPHARR